MNSGPVAVAAMFGKLHRITINWPGWVASMREIPEVGSWVPDEKHERLKRYIDISRAARKKFLGRGKAGATYIDLLAGPGKARIRETGKIIDGSPVVAFKIANEKGAPFSEIHIADEDGHAVQECSRCLAVLGATAQQYVGPAHQTVEQVVAKLNPHALHFAFLDPYNLDDLPFQVIERLAKLKRIDMLIHVSVQDLQRNLRRYIEASESPLDTFAPGWRDAIDAKIPDDAVRRRILEHWLSLIKKLDKMQPSQGIELVAGGNNQPLYWLVLVSRNSKAHEFWDKIREVGPQRRLQL